jgi:hypothetical protein
VKRIHRRRKPVFQTIISGKEVWNSVGLLGEANVLALVSRQVPGVKDVYFTHGGFGFYHAVVAIAQKRAGWSKQAILAAFAAFPPLKMVTVVDEDVNIRSAQDVEWALATRLDPGSGIVVIDKAFGHGLNPSFPNYLGPKVGFDATQPFPKRPEYERVAFRDVALEAYDIVQPEVKAAAKPAQIAPAPAAATAPLVAKSGDYDTDRIWQRGLEEYRRERGRGGEPSPVKPATSEDWNENRWWARELEEMKRERAAKKSAVPAPPAPAPAGKAQPRPSAAAAPASPAHAEPRAPRGASSDWDESRWWKRELEELKRERESKKAAAPAPPGRVAKPAAPRPAPPTPPLTARKPEPVRVEARPADDDDGGFFRGGAM